MEHEQERRALSTPAILWIMALGALYITSRYNYLLFHTLAEIFSASVALAIFLLVWNVRRSLDNGYLLVLGVAYLFVGSLDLFHTLAYKGMGVLSREGENLPTQIWIGVRYMQGLSLLVAPFFVGKRPNLNLLLLAYTAALSLVLAAIFHWNIFPACYVTGEGLTPFKIWSEYVIAFILLVSIALLIRKRAHFDPIVLRWIVISISLTILSEVSFTLYADVYGLHNLLGHLLKIVAFFCIYKAIIELGLAKPLAVLFRDLQVSELTLRRERDFISSVWAAEDALVAVLNQTGHIVRLNLACERLTGYTTKEVRGRPFWEFLAPGQVEGSEPQFLQTISQKVHWRREASIVSKTGQPIRVLWSNSFLLDEEGRVEHVVVSAVDITERKKAEDSLKKAHDELEMRVKERTAELLEANRQLSEQIRQREGAEKRIAVEGGRFRSILEGMVDGVYIAGSNGDIEYVNPVMLREFGPAEGRKCHEYLEDRSEPCPGCMGKQVPPGKSIQWEWQSHKTGKTYDRFRTSIPNADGTSSKLEILHDLTLRKKAEEALRESEMKYRIVADNTYDWEWWRSADGKFVYVSPSCQQVTHHAAEEFAADPDLLARIVHPDDLDSFTTHMVHVEEKRLQGEAEFRIVLPDGSIRWIAHACQPVFDKDGRFLGRRGSNRDVTGRKEAELALRESEERYRTLVETMNEGLGVADKNGVWTYANRKLSEMLGCTTEEIIGRRVEEWLDEANREILREQLLRRKTEEWKPYEIAWLRKDGSRVQTLVSPRPISESQGQFRGCFAVFTDITDRKRAEESMMSALTEIRLLKDRLEAENIYFREEFAVKHQFGQIIGQSNAIKYVLYRAGQVAPTNTTVLIQGETGTGKELIAAAIHRLSPRKDLPLVTVNCAALPPNLIESELFGREKGAFTGADARRIGRFELAAGSTLCLDEIGELPLDVQAKLLRVIQHGEFERLGSSRTLRVEVRIVATTNRNLEEEVRQSRFRQDLFYRLNVFPLTVPPLRQRKDDIPLLVQAFTERFAKGLGKQFTSIHHESMKALQEYDWPGNVRELENVIERAVILCPGPVLRIADPLEDPTPSLSSGLRTLEETEREEILKTLSETQWRINGKNGAAEILGLHPSTLRARMHKLGIRRPQMGHSL